MISFTRGRLPGREQLLACRSIFSKRIQWSFLQRAGSCHCKRKNRRQGEGNEERKKSKKDRGKGKQEKERKTKIVRESKKRERKMDT